jgi:hypothetical protein
MSVDFFVKVRDAACMIKDACEKEVEKLAPKTCAACRFWTGHCLKSKTNRIAATLKCELFEAKRLE